MKEKFLILEIAPKMTTGVFAEVDDDRNIAIEKIERRADPGQFFSFRRAPVRNLAHKTWEGEPIFARGRRRVIAVADSRLATTIPIPLELPRERQNEKQKITITEVENLVAQAMQRIFNGCRAEAAKRFGSHELDAILVSAKAGDFRVDGRAAGSPVGFSGKHIGLLLELTFTTRKIFEDLKPFFNAPDDFFFAEAPQVRLFSVARVRKLPLNLIAADEDGARMFVLQRVDDAYPVLYREPIDWSFAPLFGALMQALGVSKKTARQLYRKYVANGFSETASRVFKKLVEPAADLFLAAVAKGKFRGFAYIDAPHRMPFPLPHKSAGVVFEAHPTKEVLAALGFSADLDLIGTENQRHLLYLLEAYFDRSGLSEINQKLRRRLHWLKS